MESSFFMRIWWAFPIGIGLAAGMALLNGLVSLLAGSRR